jgi:uncharacterized membrane protein
VAPVKRRDDLSQPRGRRGFGIYYDPEAFGRFSEGIARFLGTARYLVFQTVVVIVWILINVAAAGFRWDPYPFILLTLVLSLQASYAAPLILLAQNRQADRDRVQVERDREVAERTQADTEFLARELAAIRIQLAGMATADEVTAALESVSARLEALVPAPEGTNPPPDLTGPQLRR